MKYNLSTEHLELSQMEKNQIDEKLERLERHLFPPFTTSVRFTHDTHHKSGQVITCTVNIKSGKKVFHAERTSQTVLDALDEVIGAIKNELEKEHSRKKDHSA